MKGQREAKQGMWDLDVTDAALAMYKLGIPFYITLVSNEAFHVS